MSINDNTGAPADRKPDPTSNDRSRSTEDTGWPDSRDRRHAPSHPSAPEGSRYDAAGPSMRPPPPLTARGPASSQYASHMEASPGRRTTHSARTHSLPSEEYSSGTMHGMERRDQPFDRVGEPSSSTQFQRAQSSNEGLSAPGYNSRGFTLEGLRAVTGSTASSSSRNVSAQLRQLRTAPPAPPPTLSGLQQHPIPGRIYQLIIRQQPQQGRLCGLGSKDKRPLDPLPILQLRILKDDGSEDEDAENSPNLMLQASLLREDPTSGTVSDSVLIESRDAEFPVTRMLEGRLIASANVARDLDQSPACFFVFTDLSIRQEGQFRLEFKLIAISQGAGNVITQAVTEPFTIYSPRRFPGMTESTPLAKHLAKQGLQVPVRNDVRRRQEQPNAPTASNDDANEQPNASNASNDVANEGGQP